MGNIRSLLFVVVFIILSACNGEGAREDSDQKTTGSEDDEGPYPIEVQDAYDNRIEIEEEPERIVSLMPSNTEIVFALDKGGDLVGVTDFDDFPEEVQEIETVGSGLEFDVERVLTLRPDLVLHHASSGDAANEGIQQLENADIDVLTVGEPTSLSEAYEAIELVSMAVDRQPQAKEIIGDIENKVEEIQETIDHIPEDERPHVWMEVSSDPELYTTGENTFMDDMLTAVGAKNAAAGSEGWVPYTEEEAVSLNPDVIITTYGDEEMIMEREAWQEVTAVQEERVYSLDGDLLSRPGPRLAEGLRLLASHIYEDERTE
ncbi:iron complex transport system substrate-binding protein [Geomicrobium halophilum]|uniref:Iron complex transport system substrate-binding protein n=1 Tax=Geomicrobium halophilum TaxID=549000 RepID=A0A841Q0L2_9BACL|nr:ABC transporter substrate-binding protein [Geomicrobium halophilum]MBB6448998.1 iron complex transport system substrate-binding protein [Geomicrobium halophilum]